MFLFCNSARDIRIDSRFGHKPLGLQKTSPLDFSVFIYEMRRLDAMITEGPAGYRTHDSVRRPGLQQHERGLVAPD